jgi:RND family efflux transporter MFP subunit
VEPREPAGEESRETDYGDDVAATELQAASARFDPGTGPRLKRAAVIAAVVLAAAFVLVSIDRYIGYRRVARATEEAASAPPAVDVIRAQAVGATQRLVLPGQTAAWHSSTIFARVNGFVAKWFVDIGDRVHRGQVLALIDTPDLDAQLAAARAQLQATTAQVLVRKAETQLSRTTYERWRDSPKGVVSEQEREEKHADYASAEARLKAAQANVALDQARVNQYAAMAEYKQVTAPYDGVITSRYIDIGNLVTAGSTSATTPLYVMTQNDPMRIVVDVPQSAAADLVNGSTTVQILTRAGAGRDYTGTLTRTSDAINPQARTLRAEVDIPNADQQLVPGMYVKVAFSLPPRGLVQVPAAALLFRASGPQVARVEPSGKISFRSVTIGRDDGSVVELAAGIAPGDLLALNVSSQIAEGDRVQAHQIDSGAAPPAATTAGR